MICSKIIHILQLLENVIIILIAGLTPVYFAVFLPTNDVFELNKLVFFRILILGWLLVAVLKYVFQGRPGTAPAISLQKLFDKYFFIPVLFFAAIGLSTVFSLDPSTSFFGIYTKYEGLASFLYYGLFFLLVFLNVRTKGRLLLALYSLAAGSAIVAGYGLVQALGWDPLNWSESTELRATSTFGQPNILAAYFLLVLPVTVYLAWLKRGWRRLVLGGAVLLQLACLVFTYSMSGWLAFVLGALAIIFIISRTYNKTGKSTLFFMYIHMYKHMYIHKRNYVLGLAVFALLATGIVYATNLERTAVNRLSGLFDWSAGSPSARLDFWSAGWEAVKDRPFLGFGPDMQREALAQKYETDWAVHSRVNVRPFRAHNFILDAWLAYGLGGLLAYGAVIWLFFSLAWDNARKGRFRGLNLALIWSVAGYLVYLLFNFHFVAGHIIFWLFLALVISIHAGAVKQGNFSLEEQKLGLKTRISKNNIFQKSPRIIGSLLLLAVVGAGTAWGAQKEVSKLKADHYYRHIRVARSAENDIFKSYELYDYLKQELPQSRYYDRQYGVILADWLPFIEKFSRVYRPTVEFRIEKIIQNLPEPATYGDYLALGRMHRVLADSPDSRNYSLSESYFKKAKKAAPGLPEVYRLQARLYAKTGEMEKAENNYQAALSRLPSLDNPNFNSKHLSLVKQEKYSIYLGVGDMYAQNGNSTKAQENYELAAENMHAGYVYGQMGRLHSENQPEKAISYYKKAMEYSPAYYYWPYQAALIQEDQGNREQALEYALKAQELNGNNMKVRGLVDNLKEQGAD